MARQGIPFVAVDDCEIWEVAAMLGANRVPGDGEQGQPQMVDPMDFLAPDVDLGHLG